jgi:hypothetical protein
MKPLNAFFAALTTAAALGLAGSAWAQPDTKSQLVKCVDTNFSTGIYSSYYSGSACGGDPLTLGGINILPMPIIHVHVKGANALNMYEVYWLPIGGDPTSSTDAVMVGNFLTDASGDAGTELRDISAPADATAATPVNFVGRVGSKQGAGAFLIFSRGPYAYDTDGDGTIDSYTTSDGTDTGTVNNPVVTLSNGQVQFISGYARP